jgi:hypothetical protein
MAFVLWFSRRGAALPRADFLDFCPSLGFRGVRANKKRHRAQIRYDLKGHYLSTSDTKQEAALEYGRKARQCGEEDKPVSY